MQRRFPAVTGSCAAWRWLPLLDLRSSWRSIAWLAWTSRPVALDLGRLDDWQAPRQTLQMRMALEAHTSRRLVAGPPFAVHPRGTANLEIAEARGDEGQAAARLLLRELDARTDAAFDR